ncbi:MAG: DUF3553 domain-containing protein [Phycisphaerales bacterium]|nr:DUF3553 domain-containing protein [Phycisphaerales bacterium]
MQQRQWSVGDRVVHAGRPEWGGGKVTAAARANHQGAPCQRLTVRFDRAGLKTLSTALAELKPEQSASENPAGGWLNELEQARPADSLATLPERVSDPFVPLDKRLEASFALYRFTGSGGSLIEWASAQTGMKDPLSTFTRQDLEAHFEVYQRRLDDHVRKLAGELRRSDPAALERVRGGAPAQAQRLLGHANARR